ncbi:neural-cadherin-like [Palaemon carinicauda]|uniref:neural-cadherin-like n=1 Tax=Palaemon carinicauda TaxID=392227 RepID=UPI0035B58563
MAINVVIPLLIPLEENLRNATRLLSGTGRSILEFTQHRYCALLREDAPISSAVIIVEANHKEGVPVRYSITGGNRDGLFTIDQRTGLITLAASLDYELYDKHELIVSCDSGSQVAHTIVQVAVADVNDNPPVFLNPDPYVTVIEEDDRHLPTTLIKVEANDPDQSDESGLLYTLRGDGVDGYPPEDAFFKINPRTGDLTQLRALDRDPPNGKRIWKLRIKVQDGQEPWKAGKRIRGPKNSSINSRVQSPSWDHEKGFQNDQGIEDNPGNDESIGTSTAKNYEVPEQLKDIGFNLRKSGVQEEDTRSRLWETNANGYDRLVSLQNGGGSTKGYPWIRERKRKYKGRPLHWKTSNDRTHSNTQLSWKLKENNSKDVKQLSWNDQARFGLPKYIYNYKNEENPHKNSWELAQKIRGDRGYSVERDGNRRIAEGGGDKIGNTNQEGDIQKRGMKKAKSAEFGPSSQINLSIGRKGKTLEQKNETLSSLSSFGTGKVEKIEKIDKGGKHESPASIRFPQKCGSPCKEESRRDHITGKHSTKQIRKNSQSSWSSSLKTKIKFRDETKSQDHSTDYIIPLNKFQVSHVSRSGNFEASTSDGKEIENSGDVQMRNNPRFGKQRKRSLDGVMGLKIKGNSNSYEIPAFIPAAKKPDASSTDQFMFSRLECLKARRNENVTCQSKKIINTKNQSTKLSTQRKEDTSENILHSTGSTRVFPRLDKNSQNHETNLLKIFPQKATATPEQFDQQNEGFTFGGSMNTLSRKITRPLKYSKVKYSTSLAGQTSNNNILSALNDPGCSFASKTKNLLTTSSAKTQQTRSSNNNYKLREKRQESKWVLKKPRGRGWVSRGVRDIMMKSPFDNFEVDLGECDEVSQISSSSADDARKDINNPVHEVEIMVTVVVKDINDNAPVFPNVTMFGEVQENGPIDLSVAQVSAWDADDSTEGTNARITYAIEKNVIHDKTGEAIFSMDPLSGLVTTALCCLDRETTPEYHIQVVAADGGGLKGTGTVVVRLTDENDNSPRLARQYWELEVDETWGDGPPDNVTLLEMTAADPDTRNHFSYKVVEESGWGWDHFDIRSTGASGQLYALKKLDYEDDTHRQGFKFMVQVTDLGDSGWVDPRHQDTAWVGVRLRDLNDNPPVFVRPHAHVTISEDAPPGTLLTTVSAHDPDVGFTLIMFEIMSGSWTIKPMFIMFLVYFTSGTLIEFLYDIVPSADSAFRLKSCWIITCPHRTLYE